MNAPVRVSVAIDPREAFLGRAAAREVLYQAGHVSLEDGFDDLISPFLEIVFPRPLNRAEAAWDHPGWSESAREYHSNRKAGWRR
jgi:hypothetical protein